MEFQEVKKIISDVMNIDPDNVTMNSGFIKDLRTDSLDIYRIFMALEEVYNVSFDDVNPKQIITVGDAVNYINSKEK